MSFGGVKATGNGHREGGWEVYDFYTETKTCYIDFCPDRQLRRLVADVAASAVVR